MNKLLILLATLFAAGVSVGQIPYNSAIPNGYTRKAMVSEQVGLTQVTITYHRPEVKGREGKVWGQLVPRGFVDQGYGNRKPAPWRAGANENTIIEFNNDVTVEGKPLSRGKYALFIAYDPDESTVIFSKRTDAWGSFYYDEKDDALRVAVKPRPVDKSVEHLKFEFTDQTPNSAVVALAWERLAIPFKLEVDVVKQQFEALLSESLNPRGWTSQGLTIAANWTLQNNYQLEKGLEWATLATGQAFPGNPAFFPAHSIRAAILEKLGKTDEAAAVIKGALPVGTVNELAQYGRQLITAKKPQAALTVFEFNFKKNPDQFGTLVGMARGLSATGDYAKALEYATKALPMAPNDQNKQVVQGMIDKLRAGKDIN